MDFIFLLMGGERGFVMACWQRSKPKGDLRSWMIPDRAPALGVGRLEERS